MVYPPGRETAWKVLQLESFCDWSTMIWPISRSSTHSTYILSENGEQYVNIKFLFVGIWGVIDPEIGKHWPETAAASMRIVFYSISLMFTFFF